MMLLKPFGFIGGGGAAAAALPFDVHLAPNTTGTGGFAVTIAEHNSGTGSYAPYPVWLEASVTNSTVAAGGANDYDPQATLITYIWKISKDGDPSYLQETYTAPTKIVDSNSVLNWAYKHIKMGKRIAHCFDSPGTYKLICTAIEDATGYKATSAETTIAVTHADDYFSAPQTFTVATSGAEYTTLQAAWTAALAANLPRTRISCNRGDTGLGNLTTAAPGTNMAEILIDDYGTGNKPGVGKFLFGEDSGGKVFGSNCSDLRVANCTVSTTGDTVRTEGSTNVDITVCGVDSDGADGLFRTTSSNSGGYWLFSNCKAENWKLYGTLVQSGASPDGYWHEGCRVTARQDLLTAEIAAGGYGIRGGNETWLSGISQTEIFTRTANNVGGAGSADPSQPCIRIGYNGMEPTGPHYRVDRTICEGGIINWGDSIAQNPSTSVLENCIFARNNDGFNGIMGTVRTGIMMRNLIHIKPPTRLVPTAGTNDSNGHALTQPTSLSYRRAVSFANPPSGFQDDPVYAKNVSLINLHDDNEDTGAFYAEFGGVSVTTKEADNILFHSPYQVTNGNNAGSFVDEKLFDVLFSHGWENEGGNTITPTHVVDYDGEVTPFTEGTTLYVGTTLIGTIGQVHDNGTTGRLWLHTVTGSVSDNNALTDTSGGTKKADAAGGIRFSGVAASWTPTSDPGNDDSGVYAPIDLKGNVRPAQQRGAVYVS